MKENLTIWSNNLFTPQQSSVRDWFCESLKEYDFHLFDPSENGTRGKSAEVLKKAQIAFGAPDADAASNCANLKWIQLNTAGYTDYDRENIKEKLKLNQTILTNSSHVFDEPCAQHLLAMITALARRLPQALDNQRNERAWAMHELRSQIALLNEETALIFGFGRIGERLAELLAPLKMNLIGVRRKITGDEKIKVITEKESDEYLSAADHVINILPDNAQTQNFFSAERLSKIKPSAFFYNIGRGTTIDQKVLCDLLNQEKIAAAYLDVTNPEPLPPDNPLWTALNCFITPHVAGGSTVEKEIQVKHFFKNLESYLNGGELRDRIL